jgi:hypothetical protein
MTNNIFDMRNVTREGRNVYFFLILEGFSGVFRIWYEDKTRANARFKDRRAINIYYEVEHSWNYFQQNKHYKHCFYEVKYVTNAMLFVERHTQYLLQEYFRRFDT